MIPLSVDTAAAVLIKMYCSLVGTEVAITDAPMEIKLSGNVSCRGDTLELKPSGIDFALENEELPAFKI
jgi:hypothetical protein